LAGACVLVLLLVLSRVLASCGGEKRRRSCEEDDEEGKWRLNFLRGYVWTCRCALCRSA
jgi:hypothetical protein